MFCPPPFVCFYEQVDNSIVLFCKFKEMPLTEDVSRWVILSFNKLSSLLAILSSSLNKKRQHEMDSVNFLFLLNQSDSVVLIVTRNHNIIMQIIMPWKIWGEFCGPKFINFRFQNLPKTKKVSFLKDGQLKNLLKVIITLKLSVVTNSRHFPLLNLHSFALSITITKETKAKIKLTQNTASQLTRHSTYAWLNFTCYPACVASVSVRFRSKERGMRIKDRAKNGVGKRAGRGWGRKEGNACRQTRGF